MTIFNSYVKLPEGMPLCPFWTMQSQLSRSVPPRNGAIGIPMLIWLVVYLPLWKIMKNISQLGFLFPIYRKIYVPNHQPVILNHLGKHRDLLDGMIKPDRFLVNPRLPVWSPCWPWASLASPLSPGAACWPGLMICTSQVFPLFYFLATHYLSRNPKPCKAILPCR